MFDILETFVDWDEVSFIQFEDVEDPVSDQVQNICFESYNMLANFNTTAVGLLLIAVQHASCLILYYLYKKSRRGMDGFYTLTKGIFFN